MSAPVLDFEGTSTPADEWAENTAHALHSSVDGGVGTGNTTIGSGGPSSTGPSAGPSPLAPVSHSTLPTGTTSGSNTASGNAADTSAFPISTTTNTTTGSTTASGNAADTSAFPISTTGATTTGDNVTPSVPGAYPRDVATDFGNAVAYAGQTVASYLPENMGTKLQSMLPGQNVNTTGTTTAGLETSLPSTEHSGAMVGEASDGAGALPGLNVEPGVAVLPEERTGVHGYIPTAAGVGAAITGGAAAAAYATKDAYNTATGHPGATLQEIANNAKNDQTLPSSGTSAGAGSLADESGIAQPAAAGTSYPSQYTDEQVSNVNTVPTIPRTSLPSQELEGLSPGEKVGGVGALPGHLTESGVAQLPDSKENLAWSEDPSSTSFAKGTPPAGATPPAVAPTPPAKDKSAPTLDNSAAPKTGNANSTANAPPGHTYPAKTMTTQSSVQSTGSGSGDSEQAPKKAKFMDKIKGEVKIVAGKMGGKPEKVEEGKALKTGGV